MMATESKDKALRTLILKRIDGLADLLTDFDLAELLHVIVIEACDTALTLEEAIPHRVLTDWADRDWSEAGFAPPWEVCEVHPQWFEITFILADDGFGVVVYVPRKERTDPVLLELCERYGVPPSAVSIDDLRDVND